MSWGNTYLALMAKNDQILSVMVLIIIILWQQNPNLTRGVSFLLGSQ